MCVLSDCAVTPTSSSHEMTASDPTDSYTPDAVPCDVARHRNGTQRIRQHIRCECVDVRNGAAQRNVPHQLWTVRLLQATLAPPVELRINCCTYDSVCYLYCLDVYRVVQKSEATTFEGSDLCMPTSSKCPNVYDKFYEYGVNRCIQNTTALK